MPLVDTVGKPVRPLSADELPLVSFLFGLARLVEKPESFMVGPLSDGGMGSLAFAPVTKTRRFGRMAAECRFHDRDGVLVTAALNLDQDGAPLELDVFKVDFSVLLRWPTADMLRTRAS